MSYHGFKDRSEKYPAFDPYQLRIYNNFFIECLQKYKNEKGLPIFIGADFNYEFDSLLETDQISIRPARNTRRKKTIDYFVHLKIAHEIRLLFSEVEVFPMKEWNEHDEWGISNHRTYDFIHHYSPETRRTPSS